MKIMICGSMTFSKEMMEAKKSLEKMGHSVSVPCNIELHLEDSGFVDNLEHNLNHCVENNTIKRCFDLLAESDAVLFLNYPKNGIDGYMGTSSLMEIGIAYHLGKKIFLMNNIPHFNEHRWAHEIKIIQPTILNGDLSRIQE